MTRRLPRPHRETEYLFLRNSKLESCKHDLTSLIHGCINQLNIAYLKEGKMHFKPALTTKKLYDAEPGELIKLSWDMQTIYALRSVSGDVRTLVCLGLGDLSPCYSFPQVNPNVISYGNDWTIHLKDESDVIDWNSNKYHNINGTILVEGEYRALCVHPQKGSGHHAPMYFDFTTSRIGDLQRIGQESTIFGKWELRLPTPDQGPFGAEQPVYAHQTP
jgi:hypothetical protein